jgi:hypothetical protein
MGGDVRGSWPAILTAGGLDASCFQELSMVMPSDPAAAAALAGTRAFRIRCP